MTDDKNNMDTSNTYYKINLSWQMLLEWIFTFIPYLQYIYTWIVKYSVVIVNLWEQNSTCYFIQVYSYSLSVKDVFLLPSPDIMHLCTMIIFDCECKINKYKIIPRNYIYAHMNYKKGSTFNVSSRHTYVLYV